MEHGMQGRKCVAILTPGTPDAAQAAAQVRRRLEAEGEAPWEAMEIEVYPGNGHSLVIARPAAEGVYISAWAARYLADRFARDTWETT